MGNDLTWEEEESTGKGELGGGGMIGLHKINGKEQIWRMDVERVRERES